MFSAAHKDEPRSGKTDRKVDIADWGTHQDPCIEQDQSDTAGYQKEIKTTPKKRYNMCGQFNKNPNFSGI